MDITTLTTLKSLSDPGVADVFKRILRSRMLSYYQLEKKEIDADQLKEALEKLQEMGLIEKKAASFSGLDKYFLTREGLEAEKLVK